MSVQPGDQTKPVTYSSCKPIRVEFNLDGIERASVARAMLLQAIGETSAATHLNLVYVGDSKRRPRWPDPTLTIEGGAWPVLIGFSDSAELPDMNDHVAGLGGSTSAVIGGIPRYVTGEIALSRSYFNSLLARGDVDTARAITLHELGHVMGLNHVDDRHQLMHPTASSLDHYGPGDLAGLAILGHGPCV
jgi:hypothetical protein